MDDKKTVTFVDRETDESYELEFSTEINGWIYDEKRNHISIAWKSPKNNNIFVGWEKTGGSTWSCWISVPDVMNRKTKYISESSPEDALHEAKMLMKKYSPEDAEDKFCD